MNEFSLDTLEYVSMVYVWDNGIQYEDKKQAVSQSIKKRINNKGGDQNP